MVSTMVSVEMSVRKPSRPWLTPTSATSNGASVRAMFSMVPSPPSTTARSASRPISSSVSTAYLPASICDEVRRSISTLMPRWARKSPSLSSGPAISGLLYLPIRPTVLNDGFMSALYVNNCARERAIPRRQPGVLCAGSGWLLRAPAGPTSRKAAYHLPDRPSFLCRINRWPTTPRSSTNAPRRCSKCWSNATSPTDSRSARARCRVCRASI